MKIPKAEKLPSGMYRIRLRLGGQECSITRSTAKACQREAELIKAEYHNGKKIEARKGSRTLREACDKYIEDKSGVLSPSTIRGYQRIRDNRFQRVMNKPVGSITNWQQLISEEARVRSPKTVINSWGFIRSVIASEGVEVPKVTLPQQEVIDQPWLDFEQIEKFLEAIKGQDCEICALCALNGLRLSEIYALHKSSVDTVKREIRVSGARVEAPTGYADKKTNKNRTSTRVVPVIVPRLVELVEALPDGPIATGSQKHLCDRINRICAANGLPEIGVHGLRRSFASWLAHEQIPEDVAMKWGGWSDMYTMRKIYQKVAPADMSSYADRMRTCL